MSASKHTPAPWELRGEHMTRYIYARGENISGIVATINLAWPGQAQRDEQLANAKLMKSAPDLLEALEIIAAQASDIVGSTDRADCMAAIASAAIRNAGLAS